MLGHLMTEAEWLAGQAAPSPAMLVALHDWLSLALCVASAEGGGVVACVGLCGDFAGTRRLKS